MYKFEYIFQSKGGILAKACEYITELRAANQGLGQCLRDNEKLRQEVTALKQHVQRLQRENDQLRKVNVVVSNINQLTVNLIVIS